MRPGDFILVRSKGVVPRLIQFCQRLRLPAAYSYWNHSAVYVGAGLFVEAKGGHPARVRRLADYAAWDVAEVAVPCEDDEMRSNAARFAYAQLGSGYGYLTIAGLVLWCLFGGRLTLGLSGTDICSGLVARATERMGVIYGRDPETVMPADLAQHFGVTRA